MTPIHTSKTSLGNLRGQIKQIAFLSLNAENYKTHLRACNTAFMIPFSSQRRNWE